MLVTGLLISLANSLAERADELPSTVPVGASVGFDCADADVAKAITITNAKAVVHIFLVNNLPMSPAGPARARGPEK
jgi:hypothetical protein